jgi:hypothetical protein
VGRIEEERRRRKAPDCGSREGFEGETEGILYVILGFNEGQYVDAVHADELVLLGNQMLALAHPETRDLQSARREISHLRGTKVHRHDTVTVRMEENLLQAHEDDLSILGTRKEQDILTKILHRHLAWIFPTDGQAGRTKSIESAVTVVTTVWIAIFLVGAVVGLYFVSDMRARLGMLACFTILFAATVAVLTNARRHDVYMATAAYAFPTKKI